MTEIIIQISIALIGIGTFVGQTRYAIGVLEKRLDSLDQKVQTCSTALVSLELRHADLLTVFPKATPGASPSSIQGEGGTTLLS